MAWFVERWTRVFATAVLWTCAVATWVLVPLLATITFLSLLNDAGTAAQQFYTCLASVVVATVDAVIAIVAVTAARRRPTIGVVAVVVPWLVVAGLYEHLRALQRLG